ncbi:MAG: redoxin family protein [Planctomycetota bacterium]
MTVMRNAIATSMVFALLLSTPRNGHAIGRIVGVDAVEANRKPTSGLALTQPGEHGPMVGQIAGDVHWTNAQGEKRSLSKLTAQGRVVVVVLRGWPGYQCPICSRQVGAFLDNKTQLNSLGVNVILIYPGPAELLETHAKEFVGSKAFSGPIHMVIDPDYAFTNAWNLRWDAPKETAYPSTYVLGKGNVVEFAKVSKTHGGRVSFATVLEQLQK